MMWMILATLYSGTATIVVLSVINWLFAPNWRKIGNEMERESDFTEMLGEKR